MTFNIRIFLSDLAQYGQPLKKDFTGFSGDSCNSKGVDDLQYPMSGFVCCS